MNLSDLRTCAEKPDGNIEYKFKLVNKTSDRIEELASQMRYRTDEGCGESIYVIGITDCGVLIGVDEDEFTESFSNLSIAARNNNYSISILTHKDIPTSIGTFPVKRCKKVYELLIREVNEATYIDIKVAIAGNVDSGKSTFLGVLTSGVNDNGRGLARLCIFNYKHEISSGRTSSISQHILGFNCSGEVTNYSSRDVLRSKSWPDIVKDSSKIISFFDLCGHEKYIRTTILGLTCSCPDLCFIMVGGNNGITRMTQEHILLCITMGIPFSIVITKIDFLFISAS